MKPRWLILALALAVADMPHDVSLAQPAKPAPVDAHLEELLSTSVATRQQALDRLTTLADHSAVPALIELLRFLGPDVVPALEALAGAQHGDDWGRWVAWLAERPEVRPSAGFVRWKSQLFARIDPAFAEFIHPGVKHRIRIEEIVWGGVPKDGIPALTNPRHIAPGQATYLHPDELVLGLRLGGQSRAYPLRIMDWHEMANDVVGGVAVSIAY